MSKENKEIHDEIIETFTKMCKDYVKKNKGGSFETALKNDDLRIVKEGIGFDVSIVPTSSGDVKDGAAFTINATGLLKHKSSNNTQ